MLLIKTLVVEDKLITKGKDEYKYRNAWILIALFSILGRRNQDSDAKETIILFPIELSSWIKKVLIEALVWGMKEKVSKKN